MMQQWHQCKSEAKDAIVLFRLGDFYEGFYEDATLLSECLGLTLTHRQGIPMSGIPAHTVDSYIEKLVKLGHLVAVAEQVSSGETKGLMMRKVTRVVSPATYTGDSYLNEKKDQFFVGVYVHKERFALSAIEVSTGFFYVAEFTEEKRLLDELQRLDPKELFLSKKSHKQLLSLFQSFFTEKKIRINIREDWEFDHQIAHELLLKQFNVASLDGFGLKGMQAAITLSGALLGYLKHELRLSLDFLHKISKLPSETCMQIDATTQKQLELVHSQNALSPGPTLLSTIDKTLTPMGARKIRFELLHPLMDLTEIQSRQTLIEEFLQNKELFSSLTSSMKHVRDLERLMIKIGGANPIPKDLLTLSSSLRQIPEIKKTLESLSGDKAKALAAKLQDFAKLASKIEETLVEQPANKTTEGGLIREGISQELDELREIKKNSQLFLNRYQEQLRERYQIKNLKVQFNRSFGYFIEVTRGQAHKLDEAFSRRQTLVNAERFTSDELKEYEEKILTAEEKVCQIEYTLFSKLREFSLTFRQEILVQAQLIGELDFLVSLAHCAWQFGWNKPTVVEPGSLSISGGRHPVVETTLGRHGFIPNDTDLSCDQTAIMLITGPNMAGKSTYIRQVALITILAQVGSFIPADAATIGLVDQIFTRIGASDDLTKGQSTFMVEMAETANILNNATKNSLVILDEIGRGTATTDGVAIAWAVLHFLHFQFSSPIKTLFATHYSELGDLTKTFKQLTPFCVSVEEEAEEVRFLHKITKGHADQSYGIHVAKLAGVPQNVIEKANEMLAKVQSHEESLSLENREYQPPLFQTVHSHPSSEKIMKTLQELDLNQLTPIEAMVKLNELSRFAHTEEK